MRPGLRTVAVWSPRLLGILVVIVLSLFALDAFEEGARPLAIAAALLIHFVPSLLLVLTIVVAWQREWIGAVVFLALAALYAYPAATRGHLDWIVSISGPLVLVGLLYVLAWAGRRQQHARI